LNIECDIISPDTEEIEQYSMLIVPAMYSAADELLKRLNKFVENGGHIVYTFKTGFTDENVKVRTTMQPGMIQEVCGVYYNMFVEPKNVGLKEHPFKVEQNHNYVETWMELLIPTTAEVIAYYDHPHWGEYAAVTKNKFGKGQAMYIGCIPSKEFIREILIYALKEADLWGRDQAISFPIITKKGTNDFGSKLHYYFNYSDRYVSFEYPHKEGTELIYNNQVRPNDKIELEPWGFGIIEEVNK